MGSPSERVWPLTLLLPCLLLFSCSYHREKGGGGGLLARPSGQVIAHVGYNDVARIFRDRCVHCHGSSGGVNLESYPAAASALGRILRSTIEEGRMPKPPEPGLTPGERRTLWAWILAGGPQRPLDGSDGGPDLPPPPPIEPTFESIRSHVFVKKCLQCHVPGGKAANVPMTTREELLDSPLDIVIPGDAESSDLILVFLPDARKPMPPPDSGISPPSAEDLQAIRDWINRGAKD